MKKILLSFLFITFPFYPIDAPDVPEIPEIKNNLDIDREINNSFSISSDESFSQEQVNFSPDQKVFVRAQVNTNQEVKSTLTLLASDKAEMLKIGMTKSDSFYTAWFNAPKEGGTYYVHVEIVGEGLSFIGEKNINVGGSGSEGVSQVGTVIENVVNTSNENTGDDSESSEEIIPNNRYNFTSLFKLVKEWFNKVLLWRGRFLRQR